MDPEKSAADQMCDAYGESYNGLETLPYITVLNKWLLDKFGVAVPEKVQGKPIVLRDGSESRRDDFYHLGDCDLGEKRTREVIERAKENRLDMAEQHRFQVREQIASNSYGAYAGIDDKKEYLDPARRQKARDFIQKAHKDNVIDAREMKEVLEARIRVERIFEAAEKVGINAQARLNGDLQSGRINAADYQASRNAINDLERRTEIRDISIEQRNTILKGALDAPRINAQMTRVDAEYLALVQKTNANTMAKYPGKTILIGAGDQQFAIPVTQSNALGVVTGETFNPSDTKLLPGSVTRSETIADIRLNLAKLQLAPSKQVAAGLDLSNPVHVEAAKRLLGGEEFLKRGFEKGHDLTPAMELEFIQYAMSDRGSAMLAGIHQAFDAHILTGEVVRDSKAEYRFHFSYEKEEKQNSHFFGVKTMSGLGATAGPRNIELGERFGRVIPISGQYVMGPEIIHHEFGHTDYGLGVTGRSIGEKNRELGFGEVRVVRDFEGPFRADFGWPQRGNYCYNFGCYDASQAQEGEFTRSYGR